MFRTRETRLAEGALFTPGAAVPARPANLPGRRLPHHNGQPPSHPGPRPAPGRISDEASARVHGHPPHTSLPLACDPGRNGVPGPFPELRTRPGRTRQRTPGRRQARTLPGLRRRHQPASFRRTHSPRATSRRTNNLIYTAWPTSDAGSLAAPNGGSACGYQPGLRVVGRLAAAVMSNARATDRPHIYASVPRGELALIAAMRYLAP
jgi:hypothetical protein